MAARGVWGWDVGGGTWGVGWRPVCDCKVPDFPHSVVAAWPVPVTLHVATGWQSLGPFPFPPGGCLDPK